jgi:PBSX family phage terminase large subunit
MNDEDNGGLLKFQFYEKQRRFVFDPTRYVAFYGGIGTGKTRGGCIKGLLKALKNPGSFGVITAPTYPMLRDATKRTFLEICPRELIAFNNETSNVVGIHTPSGKVSEIYFRSTSDPDSLRGPNLLWFYMDEAALSDYDAWLILMGRLRLKPETEQQGFITTTPRGYNWVYDNFGGTDLDEEYRAWHATTEENIFLPKSFVKSIYNQYKGSFAEQELAGKFVAFEGLVYGDLFDPQIHLLEKDWMKNDGGFLPNIPVDLAWDFGYPNPEAVLAIQQDGSGNVYIIDCEYHTHTLTEDIAAILRSKTWFSEISDCICDEARPDSITRLSNLGLPARPSQKGRILDGIQIVRSLLNKDVATQKPILHIHPSCDSLIQEFGQYRWPDKKTQDLSENYKELPIDAANHALDALRYWAILKWLPPSQSVPMDRKKRSRRIFAYQLL